MAVTGDFFCKTCNSQLKADAARYHHKQKHDLWHVDVGGKPTHRYGDKRKHSLPTPSAEAEKKNPLKITGDGDEHILEHAKGFERDDEDIVFILRRRTGQIKDMRHEFPLLQPVYELVKRDMAYGGSFPEFLADTVETLFASAGYELSLAPTQEREIFDEVVRLKRQGTLTIVYDDKNRIRLEVSNGNKIQGADERSESEHHHQPSGEGGSRQAEESSQPE